MAGVFCLLFFASGAPSPLYVVYQLRFPASTLTAVFAVYALVLLITLLFFGSVSDYLGRRRVILVSLMVSAGACALFLVAHGVGLLFAARALQGAAVGAASGALGAALIDLQPGGSGLAPLVTSAAPTLGLAAGALGTSALVEYRPAPTRLVWWLLLGATWPPPSLSWRCPSPGHGVLASSLRCGRGRACRARRGGRSPGLCRALSRCGRCAAYICRSGRRWPRRWPGSSDLLCGGLAVFLLTGIAATATVAFRGVTSRTAMLAGGLVLLAGVAVTFAAIATTAAAVFLGGTAVAGVGFGLAVLGANRTLLALATPGERARLIAAIFVVSYLALSIPALIAGVATSHFGLHQTALVYCVAIAAFAAVAAGSLMFRRRSRSRRPRHPADNAELQAGKTAVNAPPDQRGADRPGGAHYHLCKVFTSSPSALAAVSAGSCPTRPRASSSSPRRPACVPATRCQAGLATGTVRLADMSEALPA